MALDNSRNCAEKCFAEVELSAYSETILKQTYRQHQEILQQGTAVMAHHRRLWQMELVRGIISVAFGLLLLVGRSFASRLLIYCLGIYLMVDGLLELCDVFQRKLVPAHRGNWLDALGGGISLLLGLFCLLFPTIALPVLTTILALYIITNALRQVRTIKRGHEGALLFHRTSICLQILIGLFLLLVPSLIITAFVLFLGSYLLCAGFSLQIKGLSLRSSSRQASVSVLPSAIAASKQGSIPSSNRRALVFVRWNGANGLGHIGWGFEWRKDRFIIGSVENPGSKPFTPPENMGFWSTQTQDPITKMLRGLYTYDEYKLFFVPLPHPKEAWEKMQWESQEPYSFVHHNCCDVTYEILRAYGCTTLLNPAQEYVPTDWYAALPGISYPLAVFPTLPIAPPQQIQAGSLPPLSPEDTSPAWLLQLKRPWEELALMGEMMVGHLRTRLIQSLKRLRQRLPPRIAHP